MMPSVRLHPPPVRAPSLNRSVIRSRTPRPRPLPHPNILPNPDLDPLVRKLTRQRRALLHPGELFGGVYVEGQGEDGLAEADLLAAWGGWLVWRVREGERGRKREMERTRGFA
jgi:hypothetical protein